MPNTFFLDLCYMSPVRVVLSELALGRCLLPSWRVERMPLPALYTLATTMVSMRPLAGPLVPMPLRMLHAG